MRESLSISVAAMLSSSHVSPLFLYQRSSYVLPALHQRPAERFRRELTAHWESSTYQRPLPDSSLLPQKADSVASKGSSVSLLSERDVHGWGWSLKEGRLGGRPVQGLGRLPGCRYGKGERGWRSKVVSPCWMAMIRSVISTRVAYNGKPQSLSMTGEVAAGR